MQGEIWQTSEKEGKCICGRALQVLTIPKITFYVQIFRCLSWGWCNADPDSAKDFMSATFVSV